MKASKKKTAMVRASRGDVPLLNVQRERQLLEECTSPPQALEYRAKAEAMRKFMLARGESTEAVNRAGEIKVRAERWLGKWAAALPKVPPKVSGRAGGEGAPGTGLPSKKATLADAGIDVQRAAEWEKIASVSDTAFEAFITQAHESEEPITTAAAMRLANVSGVEGYDGDEWYTPSDIIEKVRRVLGEIDLDPASNEHAQTTVRATSWFSKADNGLSQPWRGRVFCNPPYSMPLIADFTAKLLVEYDAGSVTEAIYLVNNCTDSAWCHSLLRRASVCFTRGRIGFLSKAGQRFATRQGQAIFYLGPRADVFARVFDDVGTTLEPNCDNIVIAEAS